MNYLKLKLALRVVIFGVPYALLMIIGCLWLYEHRLFFPFVCATAFLSVAGWSILRWIQSRPTTHHAMPPPVSTWPPAGEKAWAEVDRLATRVEANPPPYNDADAWLRVFNELFEVVAKQFYPKSKRPALEVPVIELLAIAELVVCDLRTVLKEQVPGSDQITIHKLIRIKEWGPLANQIVSRLYDAYRLVRLALNPPSALVSEAQSAIFGESVSNLTADLPRAVAGLCVRQAGKYAIQLYSGQVPLDDQEFAEVAANKPLRIVLLGQTKAGKSSLINALFGEMRAATDVLPCTDTITRYVWERDGSIKAIVFDTIGFAGMGDKSARSTLDDELERCDLIVAVISASSAAREADRQLLDDARMRLAERTHRTTPSTVVVLSHVDTVRPLKEWNPPYNLATSESTKAKNIRDAMQAVADDLQIPRDRVVPVCLRPDAVYNVEEELLPLIVRILPEADRTKLLRLLMESRTAERQEALKRQLINAGLSVVQLGVNVLSKKLDPMQRLRG
ncbi:MAG TPA: GTPase [Pirellulales bacterium]|jgi:hypothetical protein|nr:GTPase [Pirellulales bacterium]